MVELRTQVNEARLLYGFPLLDNSLLAYRNSPRIDSELDFVSSWSHKSIKWLMSEGVMLAFTADHKLTLAKQHAEVTESSYQYSKHDGEGTGIATS